MKPHLRRFMPFVMGAVMMLSLTALLMRYRYEIEMDRAMQGTHIMLDDLSNAVASTLRDRDAPAWSGWHSGPHGEILANEPASPLLISPRLLRADLERQRSDHNALVLLGPYASDLGTNALAVAAPVRAPSGAQGWMGQSILIEKLLPPRLTDVFIKDGLRLQIVNAANGRVLYQSDEGELDSAEVATVRVSGIVLQLRAAPRDGWRLPLRGWVSLVFLLLAVIAWLAYELRRGREIRAAAQAVDEAEARRKNLNTLYGSAIEAVAALEARLQVVSMHDTVTGLANRSSLLRRIEADLDSMRQSSMGSLSVLAIGFEQIQHITNSFGAEFASRVLVVAAERVEVVIPTKNHLFRIGDFHLAVVLRDAPAGGATQLADRIIKEIEAPISLDSHTFMLHPSVGIAETASGYEYGETLLDHASTALTAVPRDAEFRCCVFDSATAKASVSRLQLEVDLIRAFEDRQFVLEYAPIVTPMNNSVAGFEALIRWEHPTEGRLLPERFLDIAVHAGMSRKLNHWVMREAAHQASLWYRSGYRHLFVSVDLAAEAFSKIGFESEIGELLAEFELPGQCLCVELTESTLIQDVRAAARTLQRLSEFGVGAWLDAFGTGYSSLSYLRQLPLKGVKIDRSFVERTVLDSRDFGFVKSLIDLISYLGMQSIADGIETHGQYELLSMTTCDLYQGGHFAGSMSAEAAERYMSAEGAMVGREMTA